MIKDKKVKYHIDKIDDRKISLINIVYIFIICAFIGWCFEEIFCYLYFGKWVKRGMMYGPFCTIYGFGGTILYLLFYNVKGTKKNIPYTFLTSALILGAFELLSGLALKYIFNQEMWNYNGEFLEILDYTTVPILIGWRNTWNNLYMFFTTIITKDNITCTN